MRAFAHLRTPAVAFVTILAMLLVPACGSLCAAMNHCSMSTTSANSDGCHHADMSATADSDTFSVSSQSSCGQQAPLVAVLTGSEPSIQLKSDVVAHVPLSIEVPNRALSQNNRAYESPNQKQWPQQGSPLESFSVLRI